MPTVRDMFIELEDARAVEKGDIETLEFVRALPAKPWLTTTDFALAAGISETTVRQMIYDGSLPARPSSTSANGSSRFLISRSRAIEFFKTRLNHM